MARRILVMTATMAALMALAGVAMAGGFAITTVDSAPDEFEAGTTYDIEYTILQHGRTPVDGVSTDLVFTPPNSEPLRFAGSPTGVPGQYVASVVLPEAGVWDWAVDQGDFGLLSLGEVEVAVPGEPASPTSAPAYLLTAAALVVGIVFVGLLRGWGVRGPAGGPSPSAG